MNKVVDLKTKAIESLYKNCFMYKTLSEKQVKNLVKIAQN